jgi:hypothetical protein
MVSGGKSQGTHSYSCSLHGTISSENERPSMYIYIWPPLLTAGNLDCHGTSTEKQFSPAKHAALTCFMVAAGRWTAFGFVRSPPSSISSSESSAAAAAAAAAVSSTGSSGARSSSATNSTSLRSVSCFLQTGHLLCSRPRIESPFRRSMAQFLQKM